MSMSHFIENTSDEPLRFLELFKSPRFMDVSLAQWMALTARAGGGASEHRSRGDRDIAQ
jgi:oxalate decarboxylase/phosphoglucose isomerase-like protein (cupin superfamily)